MKAVQVLDRLGESDAVAQFLRELMDEDWFIEAVDRLVMIYRQHPQGFVRGQGGGPEVEICSIGRMLNSRFGMKLMHRQRTPCLPIRAACMVPRATSNTSGTALEIGKDSHPETSPR